MREEQLDWPLSKVFLVTCMWSVLVFGRDVSPSDHRLLSELCLTLHDS